MVATDVCQRPNDQDQPVSMLDKVEANQCLSPEVLPGDAEYRKSTDFRVLAERGVAPCVALGREVWKFAVKSGRCSATHRPFAPDERMVNGKWRFHRDTKFTIDCGDTYIGDCNGFSCLNALI